MARASDKVVSSPAPGGMGAPSGCPACNGGLIAVSDGDMTNFLCAECGRCWHVELGRASRVDPVSCPGCPHRSTCMTRSHTDPDWRPHGS
jgi:hypothetical protein